jgi:undecaprenyl-diphosphatase
MTRSSALADRLRAYSYVPLFIFVSVSVGGLTTDLVKTIVGRARPRLWFRQEVYGFQWFGSSSDFWSFPSGHTATITALAAALYFVWPRHLLFYVLVAAIVGFARVGVGAHYPSDVLIAAAISVLTTCLTRRVFERSNIRIEDAAAGIIAPAAGPRPPWTVRLGLRRA